MAQNDPSIDSIKTKYNKCLCASIEKKRMKEIIQGKVSHQTRTDQYQRIYAANYTRIQVTLPFINTYLVIYVINVGLLNTPLSGICTT